MHYPRVRVKTVRSFHVGPKHERQTKVSDYDGTIIVVIPAAELMTPKSGPWIRLSPPNQNCLKAQVLHELFCQTEHYIAFTVFYTASTHKCCLNSVPWRSLYKFLNLMLMSRHPLSDKPGKTLALFSYDWDAIEFGKLQRQWPHLYAGFDLFSSPSSMRLAWFDMDRFCTLAALKARIVGARGVVSNHEQFGALCAALLAEKMQWPGTPVEAVLACQHKLYAREVLQRVAPEANIPFARLETAHGGDIPKGLAYPAFVKPVKAAFSVLAKRVRSHQELVEHTRFGPWERWVIHHLV